MNITVKDLLDAGVHFGHQRRRWNPKSRPFVYDHRNGFSIIDLEKTRDCLETATRFLEDIVAAGKDVLFIATKRQAQEVMRDAARACNMPFAVNRWLGGGLTNFATVKNSLEKYRRYLRMEADGTLAKMLKKEAAVIRRQMVRMNRNFEGMVEVRGLPGAVFIVDTKTEANALNEAVRLGIPVVALVDTNSDPSKINYPIPGNDDAVKSVRLIVEAVVEAVQAGIARREAARVERRTIVPVSNVEENAQPEVVIETPEGLDEDAIEEPSAEGGAAKPRRARAVVTRGATGRARAPRKTAQDADVADSAAE
ncbi:MAG: 30S ribosomal protein S2 [Puniceicoccales bacterium]|jgi:small subunit ribosomal protein S2|nr:30S ribosomal protein S2 [Puniceicoccales bacterium]